MEGDTARIFRLERTIRKHAEAINYMSKELEQHKKDTLASFLVLFTFTLLCCTAVIVFAVLK
jgi:hypothetical protein